MVRAVVLTLAIIVVSSASPAFGQTEPSAKELSAQGMKAAQGGDLEKAVSLWTRALKGLQGKARLAVHFNLGLAHSRLGESADACNHLNLYLRSSSSPEAQAVSLVQKLEEEIKATHGRVTVLVVPKGAQVRFTGPHANFDMVSPVSWWLPPGSHNVTAQMEGYQSSSLELDIAPGSDATFKLRLQPVAAIEQPKAVTNASPVHWKKGVQWALIGTGAATLVAGAVTHGIAYSRNEELWNDTYPDDPDNIGVSKAQESLYRAAYEDDVQPLLAPAYALYGVGGAMAAAGVIWMLVDAPTDDAEESQVRFSPFTAPGQAGGTFTFTF